MLGMLPAALLPRTPSPVHHPAPPPPAGGGEGDSPSRAIRGEKTGARKEMFVSEKDYSIFIFFLSPQLQTSLHITRLRHGRAPVGNPRRGEISYWEFSPASPSGEGGRRAGKVRLL